MGNPTVPVSRVIEKLDGYLNANDYEGALRHLLYWKNEAESLADRRAQLTLNCELMGLYRKISKGKEAVIAAETAISLIDELFLADSVTAGTTFLDAATVFNAFSDNARAVEYFKKAKTAYEKHLAGSDPKLAALYNNYALALVSLGKFSEARAFYEKALAIDKAAPKGAADAAITYLNMANLIDAETGFENAVEEIEDCLKNARSLLDGIAERDGYYAFVCEKCAGTFGYYGYVSYAEQLKKTAEEIYERS